MSDLILSNFCEKELPNIVDEIEESFFDIPFGNSEFQNEMFVINSCHTPERAYRQIGLAMASKIKALKEAYYGAQKEDIDIEELRDKINSDGISKYDKRRAEIDLVQKLENRKYSSKLINDAIAELNTFYKTFKKMPKYTREQFESGEREHFEIRLKKQALNIQGALESLDNMGIDPLINKLDPATIAGRLTVLEQISQLMLTKE